jgi:hypothetical protein
VACLNRFNVAPASYAHSSRLPDTAEPSLLHIRRVRLENSGKRRLPPLALLPEYFCLRLHSFVTLVQRIRLRNHVRILMTVTLDDCNLLRGYTALLDHTSSHAIALQHQHLQCTPNALRIAPTYHIPLLSNSHIPQPNSNHTDGWR